MSRHFPSFIDAYMDYSADGFCPDQFHSWTGMSLMAGALQRKVSVANAKVHFFPNIYVMLVSYPGVGKSTAIERGVVLLEEMKQQFNPNFKIIPNQVTEPAFIDLMKEIEFITPPGTSLQIPQSAGYFYASEASSSALQNVCGNFVAAMTDLYDCSRVFRKKLKGEQHTVEIHNPCMNLLSGSTFDYLKTLVNEQSAMGGFASRIIYVVSRERSVVKSKWGAEAKEDYKMRQMLVEDLADMHKLVGPFRADPSFIECYEAWHPTFQQYLIDLNSPRMESIMARKGTNVIKAAMLISVSEAMAWKDPLKPELTAYHFERAVNMVDEATKDNAFILSQAIINDKTSQAGMNQAIMREIAKHGGSLSFDSVRAIIFSHGGSISAFKETIEYMIAARLIVLDGPDRVKLLVNPDCYL